ncbi:DUF4136 domain-containing protein [Algivirga pacifica]|uniref:DUF4136 domain-containing protein n=1 Tax=Algivirga pacifica TaxID=1162670 RepID=A0ABP9DD98_9BACT
MKRPFILLSILCLFGCDFRDDERSLEDFDSVLSYFDEEQDFTQFQTFAIRDSVGFLTDDEEQQELPMQVQQRILSKIKENMIAYGYEEVDIADNPDLVLNAITTRFTNSFLVSNPGWWWGPGWCDYYCWYGGYWGVYGGYYGWYPWPYGIYSFDEATLMVEMVEGESLQDYRDWLADREEEDLSQYLPSEVPVLDFVWQAIIKGIPADTSSGTALDRFLREIDTAFEQSPILDTND